jgi:S-adenosylmethionine hydrolase
VLPIVTLTTDFGTSDSFIGAVKGVLLSHCPDVQIVDISHHVPPQNVRVGALRLASAARYFPEGTVHLCVVDPGVGAERRPIAISAGGHFFVGPDNGLLALAGLGRKRWRAVELTNPRHRLSPVSQTFHARDIFAPAAAHLACGGSMEELGPELRNPARMRWARPRRSNGLLLGVVLDVDHFGNIVTNVSRRDLEGRDVERVEMGSASIAGLSSSYDASRGLVALVGSDDWLEIAAPLGNAAAVLEVRVGSPVKVWFASDSHPSRTLTREATGSDSLSNDSDDTLSRPARRDKPRG